MKKQILILALFVMATFASVTNSYGQALAPRAITCLTPDALHPIAGQPYTYQIDVPAIVGTKGYTWYVTQNKNFIVAGLLTAAGDRATIGGTLIAAAGVAGVGYNDAGTNTLSITWKSFAYNPTNPVFVVIEATNVSTAADACTSQNLKVYKIEPLNAFSLDIANLGVGATPPVAGAVVAGYGTNLEKCIHAIVAATYSSTAPEGITYDFGTDYMFYEVVAANFTTSWKPTFTLTGIDAEETVTVEWATDKAFTTPNALTNTAGVWSSAAVYTTAAAGGAVGASGESIYVRVTLDHTVDATHNYEGLADETVVLAVDGTTNLAVAGSELGDIHTVAGATLPAQACPWVDLYVNDIATQTLNPRPIIGNATLTMPAPGLLPVQP